MSISKIMKKMHTAIENAGDGERINQADMAKKIGVSSRTYADYRSGAKEPLAMKALLNMLGQLEDEDVVMMIEIWREVK